jgi:phage shock protein E
MKRLVRQLPGKMFMRNSWGIDFRSISRKGVFVKWKLALFLTAAVGVVCSSNGQARILPADEARRMLQGGALLVDVRSPEEYAARSLPGAVNMPVDSIKSAITNRAPATSRLILLHCQSGRRSGIAEKELRAIGYTNVFNLGSFEQAARVVGPKPAAPRTGGPAATPGN